MATAKFPKEIAKKPCPICKETCGPKQHSVTRHVKRHHLGKEYTNYLDSLVRTRK